MKYVTRSYVRRTHEIDLWPFLETVEKEVKGLKVDTLK